jgi:hypothetical protein
MRIFPIVALASAAITLGVTPVGHVSAAGKTQESSALHAQQGSPLHKQVLGYQDAETGTFHPLATSVPEAVTAPIAGTITVTLHITLKTPVPAGDKVICGAALVASFATTAGATTYTESAYTAATVSGATATCVVSIPHSWQFPAKTATDIEILSGDYTAEIINTSGTLQSLFSRSSSSGFVSLEGNNIFATAPAAYTANVTL